MCKFRVFLSAGVHLLYTQCLIAGEIKTIGGGIRVPWTLFLVKYENVVFNGQQEKIFTICMRLGLKNPPKLRDAKR